MKYAKCTKELRKEMLVSQTDLVEMLGVSFATVRSAVKITQKAYGSPCLEAASFSGNTMYGALYAKGTWGRY